MTIAIAPDELDPLRTEMRDLQLSASRYYSGTASTEDIGASVRDFINHAQTLNDWFTNIVADRATYSAYFAAPRHPAADYIDAVKYVRNVAQHVMHIVRPGDNVTLVGGVFGMRIYASWDEVPASVHARLRPSTKALRPTYESKLEGKEVMSTMMEVLRFYADVAPTIIHRDVNGEWTGFPLFSQPGMSQPLHPEEPEGRVDARAWMDGRRPGGEARVIGGQLTIDGVAYLYGHTFDRGLSFAPFAETVVQVAHDLELGYPYFRGDLASNVDIVNDRYPDALQGVVLASRGDIGSWATSVTSAEPGDDWFLPGFDPEQEWRQVVRLEVVEIIPESMRHGVRRARRLNALTPPSASPRQR